MFKRLFSGLLVFGMAAGAPPASAQQLSCAQRDTVTERLQAQFGEHQSGLGLQSASRLVEVWSSPESGSWTILVTLPDGVSCVLAAGRHWVEEDAQTKADLGVPS